MRLCQVLVAMAVGIAMASCDPTSLPSDIAHDSVQAFTPVGAIYSLALTTYNERFNNGSKAPLTVVSIISTNAPNLCADLNASIPPTNASLLVLQGVVDGDVTHDMPAVTWTKTSDTWGSDPNNLDVCYAVYYNYDSSGQINASVNAVSGSVSFVQAADTNTFALDVSYQLDMQVTGTPLTLGDQNVPAPYCVH